MSGNHLFAAWAISLLIWAIGYWYVGRLVLRARNDERRINRLREGVIALSIHLMRSWRRDSHD